jgi:hypothetical protein
MKLTSNGHDRVTLKLQNQRMKQDALEVAMCRLAEQDGFNSYQINMLRILRCTAHAMASGPGGLHFVPGAKPWLDGLSLFPRQYTTSATTL